MRHVKPQLLVPVRRILRPEDFIPGIAPCPKIIGAAREVNPGSQTWSSPGGYNWTVPNFNTLSVWVRGAGGGGGGAGLSGPSGIPGGVGGYSQFSGVVAYGGGAGAGGYNFSPPPAGANGGSTGGDTNYTGGGASPGGYGIEMYSLPVAGFVTTYGGNGGYGGYSIKTYIPSMLQAGSTVPIVVGYGGAVGANNPLIGYLIANPTAGQPGSVQVSWS